MQDGLPGERLQKFLARAGIGSRRQVETWIAAGRLTIDGVRAEPGIRVSGSERICLDGQRLKLATLDRPMQTRVIALNKPSGTVTTRRDPEGRPTVFKLLPRPPAGRWITVGRLDINTSGLLLFTTDGELANRLMHPSYRIDREYAVRTLGAATGEILGTLRSGVDIDGETMAFDDIVKGESSGTNHWYYCVLQSGRNREVRRLWESQGLKVNRLKRTRYGSVVLPRGVKTGSTFPVVGEALADLCASVSYRPNLAE